MAVRTDLAVQGGGTSLLSGDMPIEGGEPLAKTKNTQRRSLEVVTQAPVTYVPDAESSGNPVRASNRRTQSHTITGFFRSLWRPVATAALGASLLLAGGCASMHHAGGMRGVPSANASVVMAPAAERIDVSDYDVQAYTRIMNRTIMKSATPAMHMMTRSPYVRQTVTGDYHKNIIPEFVVEKGANGKFTAVFLLPVSGHVGDTQAEQQANAQHYGDIDRHKIWIQYPDGTTKLLADHLDPKGDLTYAIKLDIELPKGTSQIIFSPLPYGRPELKCHDHSFPVDPDGFGPGRREIYHVK